MAATPYLILGSLALYGVEPVSGATFTVDRSAFAGWDGVASTVRVSQKPRSDGALAGRGYRQARHVSLGGLIKAPSEAAMWAARDQLNAATSLDETVLSLTGADRTRWLRVSREDEVLIAFLSPTVARWSVQLVAPDPRKFGAVLTGSTGLAVSSGGLTVPLSVPFSIDSTVTAGQVSLFNAGNVAGPVLLRIDAPVTAPVVTHVSAVTSPRALVFSSSLVLGAGRWVDVDMEARTVLENGQSSRNGWVTSRGWSRFEPGWNTWSLAAGAYDAGTTLTVTATEAWD